MKVITFSRHFPKGHPKAGESTQFVEKVLLNLLVNGEVSFSKCAELSRFVFGKSHPMSYIDTLRRYDCSPLKAHTIRTGNRFNVGDMVSLRVWSGLPYRSKQIEFAQVEVKKTWDIEINEFWWINGEILEHDKVIELASNDGLTCDDFVDWFKIHPKKSDDVFKGQIICWSDSIEYGKPKLVTETTEQELADKFKALISERTELDLKRGCGVSLDKNEYIGDRLADIDKEIEQLKTPKTSDDDTTNG